MWEQTSPFSRFLLFERHFAALKSEIQWSQQDGCSPRPPGGGAEQRWKGAGGPDHRPGLFLCVGVMRQVDTHLDNQPEAPWRPRASSHSSDPQACGSPRPIWAPTARPLPAPTSPGAPDPRPPHLLPREPPLITPRGSPPAGPEAVPSAASWHLTPCTRSTWRRRRRCGRA